MVSIIITKLCKLVHMADIKFKENYLFFKIEIGTEIQ